MFVGVFGFVNARPVYSVLPSVASYSSDVDKRLDTSTQIILQLSMMGMVPSAAMHAS